jgi:hypothetical protein
MFWYAQLYVAARGRITVALGLFALGVALEYLQALTPSRHFSYLDMRDDAIGVAAGWIFAAVTSRWVTAKIRR